MALMPCRECRSPVSTEAKSCPACGAPVVRPPNYFLVVVGFVLAGALAVWGVANTFGACGTPR